MPRQTKAKKNKNTSGQTFKTKKIVSSPNSLKQKKIQTFPWGASYINFLLGIIFVIIAILFTASLIKVKHTKDVTSTSTSTIALTPTATPTPSPYIVQTGDDLWSIAEKVYKNGYKWVDIAHANNLTNPNTIYKGDKLVIPELNIKNDQTFISNTFPTQQPQNFPEQKNIPEAITGTEYIVIHGDNLWDIALRSYADGYKWVDIAKANHLTNPALIHAGNVFIIPR